MKSKSARYWIQKLLYKLSLFDYGKCTDCKWDNIGNPYCKPPLGQCVYEEIYNQNAD